MNSSTKNDQRATKLILLGLAGSALVFIFSIWLKFDVIYALIPIFIPALIAFVPAMLRMERVSSEISKWLTQNSYLEQPLPTLENGEIPCPSEYLKASQTFRKYTLKSKGYNRYGENLWFRTDQYVDENGKISNIPSFYVALKTPLTIDGWVLLYPQNGPELETDISLESRDFNTQVRVWASNPALPFTFCPPDIMAWYLDLPEQPWINFTSGWIFLGFPTQVSVRQILTLPTSAKELEKLLQSNHLVQ